MKRGTVDHPKTHRLARLLGLEPWGAVGVLESLWHWASRYAIRGDVGRWPDADIADGIGWRVREPGELICALTEAGWLDAVPDPEVRLVIHDAADHADNIWRQNLVRAGLGGFWNGAPARHERVGRPRKLHSNEFSIPPPEPEPEPEPSPDSPDSLSENPTNPTKYTLTLAHVGDDASEGFAQFWSAYPRKVSKQDARKAWKGEHGDRRLATILAGIARWTVSESWQRGFIPYPAKFLRHRQWEDEVPPAPEKRLTEEEKFKLDIERRMQRMKEEGKP